jgi:transketolase
MGTTSQREAYGKTLVRLGMENERIVVLDADLCRSTMGILFEEAFPKRHFEMGIAEQNMASFAAGLSLTGKIPFINSFAVFATGRAYDQIRQSICIVSLNVKIVGSSYGLSDFGDGATHQSVEDIAIMRAIPNMTVLAPADAAETVKIVEAAVEYEGPVYLRLNRNPLPDIYDEGYDFKIGMPSMVKDGTDIVIFAHGILVFEALEAARSMEDEGISVRVVNVSTLKPVNGKEIKRFCEGMKGIVTAEEHSIIGGLGDIVSAIMKGSAVPMETIGILDQFGQSSQSYLELLEHYGLTRKEEIEAVRRLMIWK